MFTGIVETLGRIERLKRGRIHTIEIRTDMEDVNVSDSISINGICLTVTELKKNGFIVEAVEETYRRTTLRFWKQGDYVNLERSLKADGRLGGHILLGHVDTTGRVVSKNRVKDDHLYIIEFPERYQELVVEKGSIGIDGVSLTVGRVTGNRFEVHIVPYTYRNTTFKYLKPGRYVNLEFDIVGKYIINYLKRMR